MSRRTLKSEGRARAGMVLPRGAKQRAPEVLARLRKEYPEPYFFLKFDSPFQLLVSVILSAQTTDAQVNKVTPALFAKYPTPEALAKAPRADVERLVFQTGFYKSKAKHIQGTAQRLVDAYGGEVPTTMADLMTLPGVARKTANVVQELVSPGTPEGVCVDTHVKRVAFRLGLASEEDATKAEQDLMKLYPREDWGELPFYFITHGRAICDAKKPKCSQCFLADLCPKRGVTTSA
jgi:endonuclease III